MEANIYYLEQLAKEINILMTNKCYLSAVNNAMVLLDSMTKANNFPYAKSKESDRFVHFCDDCLHSKSEIGLTGDELYSIRNFMFHEGCMNLNTKKTVLKSINFYINEGYIHSNTIYNNGFANIDVITFVKIIMDYFQNNKSKLNMAKIAFICA